MKQRAAFSILELLVAIAAILALAAITHAVLTRARLAADNSTCLVRLRTIQNAIDVYRADWGNASATSGSPVMLGLPTHPWFMLYTLSPDSDERSELLSCQLISRQTQITMGIDWKAWPWPQSCFGGTSVFPYEEATRQLGGETPLFVDAHHNPMDWPDSNRHIRRNRGIRRLFLYTTLDSNVRSEHLVGIAVNAPPSTICLRDWVKVKTQQQR